MGEKELPLAPGGFGGLKEAESSGAISNKATQTIEQKLAALEAQAQIEEAAFKAGKPEEIVQTVGEFLATKGESKGESADNAQSDKEINEGKE